MKVSLTQANLHKSLNHILKATASKPNIPILANVLIKAEKGVIRFAATDLEISVSAEVGGEIGEEGELTVNARLLTEFVAQLSSNKIELLQTGQSLEVKSVDNSAQLYIIPADDFPPLPEVAGEPDLVVAAQDLREAIAKTTFAAASDQSRPVLTGILLEATKRKLSLVGVDGFRLSQKFVELADEAKNEELSLVVPATSLQEVAKIITDEFPADESSEEDLVQIFHLDGKNQVLFKVGDVVISSRLIEGEYPDYKKIIPSEYNFAFVAHKAEISHSVKVANIFARNIVGSKTLFKIFSEEKQLHLSAKVEDMGNNESVAELDDVEGEQFETAYNAKFLSDMLGSISGETIRFEANSITAPGVFRDPNDPNYLHVIMPMRIQH
ncbi:MAG: DNA polymerase III subunit beta [Candidatus Dojkabacteria bacterium]